MNTLELYGVVYYHLLVITVLFELLNIGLKRFSWYKFIFTSGILPIVVTVQMCIRDSYGTCWLCVICDFLY